MTDDGKWETITTKKKNHQRNDTNMGQQKTNYQQKFKVNRGSNKRSPHNTKYPKQSPWNHPNREVVRKRQERINKGQVTVNKTPFRCEQNIKRIVQSKHQSSSKLIKPLTSEMNKINAWENKPMLREMCKNLKEGATTSWENCAPVSINMANSPRKKDLGGTRGVKFNAQQKLVKTLPSQQVRKKDARKISTKVSDSFLVKNSYGETCAVETDFFDVGAPHFNTVYNLPTEQEQIGSMLINYTNSVPLRKGNTHKHVRKDITKTEAEISLQINVNEKFQTKDKKEIHSTNIFEEYDDCLLVQKDSGVCIAPIGITERENLTLDNDIEQVAEVAVTSFTKNDGPREMEVTEKILVNGNDSNGKKGSDVIGTNMLIGLPEGHGNILLNCGGKNKISEETQHLSTECKTNNCLHIKTCHVSSDDDDSSDLSYSPRSNESLSRSSTSPSLISSDSEIETFSDSEENSREDERRRRTEDEINSEIDENEFTCSAKRKIHEADATKVEIENLKNNNLEKHHKDKKVQQNLVSCQKKIIEIHQMSHGDNKLSDLGKKGNLITNESNINFSKRNPREFRKYPRHRQLYRPTILSYTTRDPNKPNNIVFKTTTVNVKQKNGVVIKDRPNNLLSKSSQKLNKKQIQQKPQKEDYICSSNTTFEMLHGETDLRKELARLDREIQENLNRSVCSDQANELVISKEDPQEERNEERKQEVLKESRRFFRTYHELAMLTNSLNVVTEDECNVHCDSHKEGKNNLNSKVIRFLSGPQVLSQNYVFRWIILLRCQVKVYPFTISVRSL